MEKKVLIAATILVAVLFGLMFQEVWQAERVPDVTQSAIRAVPVTHPKPALDTLDGLEKGSSAKGTNHHENDTDGTNTAETKITAKSDETTPVVVEKAPPVFGMMQSGKTTQIVGLLASEEQNGTLGRFLKDFCQTHHCKSDLDYQTTIESAPWQKDVVALVQLITEGKLAAGSLFIENNTIKIEGNVTNNDTASRLQSIFASLKEEGLQLLPSKKLAESLKLVSASKETPEKQIKTTVHEVDRVAQSSQTPAHAYTEKEEQKNVVPQPPVSAVSVAEGKSSNSSKAVSKKVSHKTGSVKSTAKKRHKKHIVHKREKPKTSHEIIAPSYMETAYDLQKKIEAKRMNIDETQSADEEVIFEEDKKPDDMIAKPKFEILH